MVDLYGLVKRQAKNRPRQFSLGLFFAEMLLILA